MQTPQKQESPEVKRGPKPKVSAFESNEKEAPEEQIESVTNKSKEPSIDLLLKISPKTRKSTQRSAKKTLVSRPATRGSTAAAEKKITPFEANVKTPKKQTTHLKRHPIMSLHRNQTKSLRTAERCSLIKQRNTQAIRYLLKRFQPP